MSTPLQKAFEAWQRSETDENYRNVVNEVHTLIRQDAMVFINGLPMYDKENRVDPMGINGPDGLFYMIVFAEEQQLKKGKFDHPAKAGIRDLIKAMWMNRQCGGICINYAPGEKVPLIPKKTLVRMWNGSLEEKQ